MKKYFLTLSSAALLIGFSACNNEPKSADATEVADSANEAKFDDTHMEDDAEWASKAAEGGMIETMLGKAAAEKATNPAVKEFGQMMVTDHSKVNEELSALAMKKNITLPTSLSPDMQKSHDKIIAETGADFDKDFMDEMVKDHEMMVDHFKKEASDGKDADMKAFAAGKVAALEAHLAKAKTIRDGLK